MEIGPIFRALIQKKFGVFLLVAEIAVTLAVVLNCINLVVDNRKRLMIPSGVDEHNIIVLSIQSYGDDFEEDEFSDQIRQQDLDLIRAQPGVIDATPISPLPLQGGGSSTQRKVVGAVSDTLVRTPIYRVDEHFLDTLDLELHEGRTFTRADILPRPDPDAPPVSQPINVIVTKALGDALFPDGDALGKVITSGNDQAHNTIIGIVEYMHTPYDGGASGMEYRILFFPGRPGSAAGMSYLVRSEPQAYAAVRRSAAARCRSSRARSAARPPRCPEAARSGRRRRALAPRKPAKPRRERTEQTKRACAPSEAGSQPQERTQPTTSGAGAGCPRVRSRGAGARSRRS